jgi:hypothetical protein
MAWLSPAFGKQDHQTANLERREFVGWGREIEGQLLKLINIRQLGPWPSTYSHLNAPFIFMLLLFHRIEEIHNCHQWSDDFEINKT